MTKAGATSNFWLKLTDVKRHCRKFAHLSTTKLLNISKFLSVYYILLCAEMSSFEPNTRHFRELLIYFFNLKKSAVEAHRLLVERYGEAASSERNCRE